ncbi:small multi-drug export protein [Candidatus Woesearchaeota archaeon]|nr:small multi-drug export protein [Candidatus Woesearchaeota archaeon]
MNEILNLIWITFLPFLELRASIPYGILKTGLNWALVFAVCVATNIFLGIALYFVMDKLVKTVTRIRLIDRIYQRYVERMQKRINKYVDRYGELAIAVFIGIPLPGSGVYSGAIAAYLIGLEKRKFAIANIIGVLIAGVIVTIISLTGAGLFNIFIKMI